MNDDEIRDALMSEPAEQRSGLHAELRQRLSDEWHHRSVVEVDRRRARRFGARTWWAAGAAAATVAVVVVGLAWAAGRDDTTTLSEVTDTVDAPTSATNPAATNPSATNPSATNPSAATTTASATSIAEASPSTVEPSQGAGTQPVALTLDQSAEPLPVGRPILDLGGEGVIAVSPTGLIVYGEADGDAIHLKSVDLDGNVSDPGITLTVPAGWDFGPDGSLFTIEYSDSYTKADVTEYVPSSSATWLPGRTATGEITGECGFRVEPSAVGCPSGTGPSITIEPSVDFDRVTADSFIASVERSGNGINHRWSTTVDEAIPYNCDDDTCAFQFLPGPGRGAVWVPYLDGDGPRRAVFVLDDRSTAGSAPLSDDIYVVGGVVGTQLIASRQVGNNYELVTIDLTSILDPTIPWGPCEWRTEDLGPDGAGGHNLWFVGIVNTSNHPCRVPVVTAVNGTSDDGSTVHAEFSLFAPAHPDPMQTVEPGALRAIVFDWSHSCEPQDGISVHNVEVHLDDGSTLQLDTPLSTGSCNRLGYSQITPYE